MRTNEIDAMRTFVRVVERGSFTAVAREVGIGQPAVSKQIASLEARFGVQLLRRASTNMSVTDAGRDFYESAVQVLEELDAMSARLGNGQKEPSGLVRVSVTPVLARLYITPQLPAFLERYPKIDVELRVSERTVNLVEEGLDLAVKTGELQDSTLTVRRIATTPIVTVATPSYLEAHGTPRHPADLDAHRCILFSPFGAPRAWSYRAEEGLVRYVPHGRLRTNDGEQIRAAVLAGLGIAYTPAWLFARELASGEVRALFRKLAPPPLAVSVVHPAGRRLAARARLFIEFLEGVLAASWRK